GVTVDPATETTACVGSKEGISKFLLAHFDPGDTLLLCTPCYPAYIGQAAIAQIRVVEVPLDPKRGMLPDLSAISTAEASRAKERTIEFHSFSKSYSMQGWRVAMATGNPEVIQRIVRMKSNMDYGVFMAIQRAAIAVLSGPQDYCAEAAALYRRRRDAFLEAI